MDSQLKKKEKILFAKLESDSPRMPEKSKLLIFFNIQTHIAPKVQV